MLKLKDKKSKDNFLLYIPYKNHDDWCEREDKVYLRFTHDKTIEKIASWLTKRSNVSDVELDKMGTAVWKFVDGEKTVYEIGHKLLDTYGKECEPVYKRLSMYLRYLNKKGWIKFKNIEVNILKNNN